MKGAVESGQLPPCNDTVGQHERRGNYQSTIWKRCLENYPIVPPPEDNHGWVRTDEGKLQILWITGAPAPDVVLEFILCKCHSSCEHYVPIRLDLSSASVRNVHTKHLIFFFP
jgi:hypothetical protein